MIFLILRTHFFKPMSTLIGLTKRHVGMTPKMIMK